MFSPCWRRRCNPLHPGRACVIAIYYFLPLALTPPPVRAHTAWLAATCRAVSSLRSVLLRRSNPEGLLSCGPAFHEDALTSRRATSAALAARHTTAIARISSYARLSSSFPQMQRCASTFATTLAARDARGAQHGLLAIDKSMRRESSTSSAICRLTQEIYSDPALPNQLAPVRSR